MSRQEFLRLLAPIPQPGDLQQEVLRCIKDGRCRRGIGLIDHLLTQNPRVAWAWEWKSSFVQRLGFIERSIHILTHAVSILPGLELQRVLARTLSVAGRHAEAIDIYRKLLQFATLDQTADLEARLSNALVLSQPEEQRALHRAAISRAPGRGEPYLEFARWLINIDLHAEALQVVDEGLAAVATGPLHGELLEERSYLMSEEHHPREALAAADRALRISPESLRASYLRARALGNLGRLKRALIEIEHILAREPNHADAKRAAALLGDAIRARPWWRFWD